MLAAQSGTCRASAWAWHNTDRQAAYGSQRFLNTTAHHRMVARACAGACQSRTCGMMTFSSASLKSGAAGRSRPNGEGAILQ